MSKVVWRIQVMVESDLVYELKQNNNNAFKYFVETNKKMVFQVCYSFLHHSEDAEDLCQEVFVEVLKNIEKFKGNSKLSTWLYRIAVNKSLNYIRDYKKKRKLFSELPEDNNIEGLVSMDEDSLKKEHIELLMKFVDSLPKKQKVALLLNKLDGIPAKEIAEILKTSISSVEISIYRARVKLKKNLLAYYKSQQNGRLQ